MPHSDSLCILGDSHLCIVLTGTRNGNIKICSINHYPIAVESDLYELLNFLNFTFGILTRVFILIIYEVQSIHSQEKED